MKYFSSLPITGVRVGDTTFVLIYCSSVALFFFVFGYLIGGISPVPAGPMEGIAALTRSLVHEHSFSPLAFSAERDALVRTAQMNNLVLWQDIFALGENGRLYLKHSPISAILALPAYLLFGEWGFPITQLFLMAVTLTLLYAVLLREGIRVSPSLYLLSLILGTQLSFSAAIFIFSYDFHTLFFILGALYVAPKAPFSAALWFCLALFIRPSHLLFSPVLFLMRGTSFARSQYILTGLLAGVLVYLSAQYLQFGIWWTTPYAHLPQITPDGLIVTSHPDGLSWKVFASQWGSKLFSLENGLLIYNPVLLLIPWSIFSLSWRWADIRDRPFIYSSFGLAIIYTLYIFSYEFWSATQRGNRFLLPSIVLCLPIIFSCFPAKEEAKST